ncbi:MAG TPA: PDZ domain-containing protein, partial [Microbacteriaceae bacterium]|nr:PDZ domain-containing protein [Microbacteriaceae bacterium]
MTLFDSDFAPRERPRWSRRQRVGGALIGVALASAATFAVAPSPYVIEQPGPVYDTIGSVTVDGSDVALITISGTESYETTGSLDMLTVSIVGNPEQPLSWLEAGWAWFQPHHALLPMDAIFPPGQTAEQQEEENQAQMVNSQQEAVAAALTDLGYTLGERVAVAGLAKDAAATGLLEAGDIIVSANGIAVKTVAELKSQVNARSGAAVELRIERDGATRAVSVVPSKASDGSWVLGIGARIDYTFPFEVKIQLDNVGGPSAGMMFALGIIAKLTPGGITGGAHWAGTGTIDAGGAVGPIGGIAQKMAGARAAGADYMLAPLENCDEVTGNIPDGLTVFAVSTLSQARSAVET